MTPVAIRVRNLSKRYTIGGKRVRHATLSERLMAGLRALAPGWRSRTDTFWALRTYRST